jgi:hypothetical protein
MQHPRIKIVVIRYISYLLLDFTAERPMTGGSEQRQNKALHTSTKTR